MSCRPSSRSSRAGSTGSVCRVPTTSTQGNPSSSKFRVSRIGPQLLNILESTAEMYFRPVDMCGAGIHAHQGEGVLVTPPDPASAVCPAANQLTAANLNVEYDDREATGNGPAWTGMSCISGLDREHRSRDDPTKR